MTPEWIETAQHLAPILTGEASLCPVFVLFVIGHTYQQRNDTFTGWQPPTDRSLAVTMLLPYTPDFWRARYVLSHSDITATDFGQRIADARGPPVVVDCERGRTLYLYH